MFNKLHNDSKRNNFLDDAFVTSLIPDLALPTESSSSVWQDRIDTSLPDESESEETSTPIDLYPSPVSTPKDLLEPVTSLFIYEVSSSDVITRSMIAGGGEDILPTPTFAMEDCSSSPVELEPSHVPVTLVTSHVPVTVVTNIDHVPVTVISQTVAEVMTTATVDGVTGASDKEGKALDGITVTPASDDDTTTADASSTPDALIITTTTTAEETTGQEWTLASSESVENVQTVSVPTVEGADTTTEDSDDAKLTSDPMATLSTVGIDQDLVSTTENSLYHDTTSGSVTPAFVDSIDGDDDEDSAACKDHVCHNGGSCYSGIMGPACK